MVNEFRLQRFHFPTPISSDVFVATHPPHAHTWGYNDAAAPAAEALRG